MEKERRLKILYPGGELAGDLDKYLKAAGLNLSSANGSERCYLKRVENMPLDFIVIRATSIPDIVRDSESSINTGITGSDILWDAGWGTTAGIELDIPKLVNNATESKLYVGISSQYIDRTSCDEYFIKRLQGGILATKYLNVAKDYLAQRDLKDVGLKFAPGKDESYQYAYKNIRGVLGIWSSGKTARANNIIPLEMFHSVTTRLISNADNSMNTWEKSLLDDFRELCYTAEQGRNFKG